MKDHYYNEGYAYVKGYDQFNQPKTLSGLNVVSGVGTFTAYDSDTGKITIKDTSVDAPDETGAFLTIKEVPVFVQYQEGTNVVSANDTLTVSTRAYLGNMEFGEIKKNSTDKAERLTLDELRSGLWYVEINNAEDQYGNALTADDLQDQRGDTPVLFVIPGDTGAFYHTGKFSTLNGKTVLWLEGDADSKPGKMDLQITGAGGKTFKKEAIEIFDNPYIDVLDVDYPDLYEGMTESKKLNFSAVDQYGDDIDLWDFRPSIKVTERDAEGNATAWDPTTIVFGDVNGMTGVSTEIKVSGGAFFNTVEVDTKAKTFEVKINVGTMEGKDMAVFTTTTAGTKVATQTVTIGERGSAAKIASSFPSTKKLDPNGSWNVNADIEFVDVNGNVMTRYKNNDLYPYFVDGDFIKATVTDDALKTNEKPDKYVWTLSTSKINNAAAAQAAAFDEDGKIVEVAGDSDDYYATVFGEYAGHYYILDSKTVRVSSIALPAEKVDVVAPGTLYADPKSEHSVQFKVKLTNEVGESWTENATSVSVGGIFADTTDAGKVGGKIATELPADTTATVPVSVYYLGALVGTTTLTYTNVKPVATTTKFEYTVQDAATDDDGDVLADASPENEIGRAGVGFTKAITGSEFFAGDDDGYKIAGGVLTITNANSFGDTYTAKVVDQYGVTMKDTVFYLNGAKLTSGDNQDVPEGRNIWEFKNDTQGKAFYMTSDGATVDVEITGNNIEVSTSAELIKALKEAKASTASDVIEVVEDINLAAAIEVAANDELVIPFGLTVDTNKAVTNNGTIRGSEAYGENDETTSGTLKINGARVEGQADLIGTGRFDLGGESLELDNVHVSGDFIIRGNVEITGDVLFDEDSAVQFVQGATNIQVADGGSVTFAGEVEIVADEKGTAVAEADLATATISINGENDALSAETLKAGENESGEQPGLVIDDEGNATVVSPEAKQIVEALAPLAAIEIESLAGDDVTWSTIQAAYNAWDSATNALDGDELPNDEILALVNAESLFGTTELENWAALGEAVGAYDEAINNAAGALVGASLETLADTINTYLENGTGSTSAIQTAYNSAKKDIQTYCTLFELTETPDTITEMENYVALAGAKEIITLRAVTATIGTGKISLAGLGDFTADDIDASSGAQDKATVEEGTLTDKKLDVTVSAVAAGAATITIEIAGETYTRTLTYAATVTASTEDELVLTLAAAENEPDKITAND